MQVRGDTSCIYALGGSFIYNYCWKEQSFSEKLIKSKLYDLLNDIQCLQRRKDVQYTEHIL